MEEKGQSLIELIVAIGIFALTIAGLTVFILNSYVSGRLSYEITKADLLTQEGLEAVKSIRDHDWAELIQGNHALTILDNKWAFHPTLTEEDISDQLKNGKRIIQIEDVGQDRKKITSKVNWQFSEGRAEEVKLISYLTNWQKIPVYYCTGICTPCESFVGKKDCDAQSGCSWSAKLKICTGNCISCDTFLDQASCENQSGCVWASE